ncbi:hypothetical protein CSC09_4963 [Escherichia coli]|nr:hypothetical protein CSC09_4963 [Escherichia coli]
MEEIFITRCEIIYRIRHKTIRIRHSSIDYNVIVSAFP